jgi:hypothetical protein
MQTLLDLPDEVLRMILSYIPDQLSMGQTCRKFYDLSCSLEGYSLIIETTKLAGDSKKKVTEFLEDESIFDSIVNSKRRIENLELISLNLNSTNGKKLQRIIENFGARIKTLTVSNCRLSKAEVGLINAMPELMIICLESVKFKNIWSVRNFQLNLPKLRMLVISHCAEKVLEVFDKLPDDVLESSLLRSINVKNSKKYFANQRKLKSICVFSCPFNPLDMEQLSLEELKTDMSGEELKLMLKKQESLKTLLHGITSQADFNFICNHLNSLDRLEIILPKGDINFSELADLKQLKTFKVQLVNEGALRSIKSSSVKTLEIILEIVSEETVMALAAICPSVVNLDIYSDNNDDAINWSLQNFPQLETLTCCYIDGEYTFTYNLAHLNLKKFEIIEFDFSIDFLFLLSCLENLEVFKTHQEIDWQDLRMILSAKKLKALCLTKFPIVNEEFIGTLNMLGKDLESFHVQQVYDEDYEDYIFLSPGHLREEFKDQFPVFSLRPGKKWLMKKSNKPNICCDC